MQAQLENKILLHACCGICSAYPIKRLRAEGFEPIVYFYNPNIYPFDEYTKRLSAQKTLCREFECELIVGSYNTQDFYDEIKGLENEPEGGKRCEKCFKLRLLHSAKIAKNLSIKNFTTSMVISPHKNFELLSKIGEEIAKEQQLNYVSIDFKKKDGFLKTNKIAKDLKLY